MRAKIRDRAPTILELNKIKGLTELDPNSEELNPKIGSDGFSRINVIVFLFKFD